MNLAGASPFLRHWKEHESFGLTPAYVDPEYVFTFIRSGEGVFLLEDSRHRLGPGDCILLPPYMKHIINVEGASPMGQYVLHFDIVEREGRAGQLPADQSMSFSKFRLDAGNPESMLCEMPRVSRPSLAARLELERAILEMRSDFERPGPWSPLALKARMLDVLRLHFASAPLPGARGSGSAANRPQVWRNLDRAIKFIHERYGEDIGLAQMAKAAGLSPNYFCQLFADYAGCAPRKYLNAVRLQEAKRLIEEGSLNFTQIAARCGFGSIHSFSKVFRRLEGKSPSDCKAGL